MGSSCIAKKLQLSPLAYSAPSENLKKDLKLLSEGSAPQSRFASN